MPPPTKKRKFFSLQKGRNCTTAVAKDDAPSSLRPGIDATWKSLQKAGNVPGDIELDDFINADADVIVHEELNDEDVIKSVREPEEPSDSEDDSTAQDLTA